MLNAEQKKMFKTYIRRIQEYPDFADNDLSKIPIDWQYSINSSELNGFIERNQLKKIADAGSDIDKFLNLMDWVHAKTESKGELGNPDTLNAPAILRYVERNNCAVNCWMKSIVLNEILLSFGYYSRRISFMPAVFDGDSHSIVTVFCPPLEKWICLDPTFNTYFYDESGEMMSYCEIRNAYKSGKTPSFRSIRLNPGGALKLAGKSFDRYDQWYMVYMAKNCFRASCPLTSAYGYENSASPVKAYLLPKGYDVDKKDSCVYTTNSLMFFAKP
ncbi:hypothetical protein JW935_04590 [candidate division KSB1 bacterium]|nr:hypothetical protein [candidate division KSB1 bacterium]